MILGPELLHTPASLSPRPSPSPHPTCAWQRPTSPARVTQTTLRAVPKDAACLEQPEHRVSLGRLPGPHGDRAARRGGCQERNCRPAPLPSWSHECLEVTYTWGGGASCPRALGHPPHHPPPPPVRPPSCQNEVAWPSPGGDLDRGQAYSHPASSAWQRSSPTRGWATPGGGGGGPLGPGPSLKPPWLSSQPQRSPDSAQVWTSGKEHLALVTFLVQIPLWGVMSAQLNPQGRKHTRRPSSLLPLPRQQKFTREVPPGSLLSSAPHLAVAPDSLRPWGGNAQRPELSHLATSSTDQWEDQLEPSQPGPADHPQRLPAGGHQTCYQHLRNAPCPTSSALEPSPKVCIALTRSREGGPLPLWLGKHWEKGRGTSVPLCGASCLPAPPTPHCA